LPLETAPQEIRVLVYRYRAERDALFPNIFDVQSEYFTLDRPGRKQYLKDYPELAAYWDWQRGFFAAFPPTIPYIRSIEAIAGDVLGEETTGGNGRYTPTTVPFDIQRFPSALLRQLLSYSLRGEALSSGALKLLHQEHKRTAPWMSFEAWLEQVVYPAIGIR